MYRSFFKRIIDFTLAFFGLLLTLPIIFVVTVLLFISNSGKPFFFQIRPGKNEKHFKIIKFKTMNDKTDNEGKLLPDGERLTNLGRFLRLSSLDELPQLINILLGNMSIIGPRPLLVRYLPYYTQQERLRHTVRPGITGLAQISGRNLLDWDSRLKKDTEYVEKLSLKLDLQIFFKTIKNVLTSKDVAVNPNAVIEDLDAIRQTH